MLTRSAEWVGWLDDSASEGLKRAGTTVSLNWGIPTIPVQAFQADEDILDYSDDEYEAIFAEVAKMVKDDE